MGAKLASKRVEAARGSRRGWDYILLALGALGLWATFPDIGAWYLAAPSLALVISAVDRVRTGRAAWYGFIFGWSFFLAHIWWATISVGTYLPWAVLAGIQGLFIGAWAATIALMRPLRLRLNSILFDAVLIALTWAGMEQVRSRIPFGGFPWALVSYSQVDSPLGHLAPWGSEVTIAVALLMISVALRRVFSLVEWQRPTRWWTRPIAGIGALALAILPILLPLPAQQEDGAVRVGLIQGNVELPADATFAQEHKVTDNHLNTTGKAVSEGMDADLVLWGENSLDRDLSANPETMRRVKQASQLVKVPLLVGTVRYEDGYRYNDAVAILPGGQVGPTYTKQLPVPFGEYIPMRDFLSILSKETARIHADMLPGKEPGLMTLELAGGKQLPIAIGICFEAAYERIFAGPVRDGGALIVVPTNNSSFGYSAESTQQLQMVRLRAMSLSRSAVQVSTNGVSALIYPDGSVLADTKLFEPSWRVANLPLRHTVTFSARFKPVVDTFAMSAWGLVVFSSLYLHVLESKRGRTKRRRKR
ncbi:MAG: apolipoprotein N-acyltransferase [Actinomycetaceae bacterium]|nr:apolipoprotein N-acyltransferase [Actinomycetaceae bacterium]